MTFTHCTAVIHVCVQMCCMWGASHGDSSSQSDHHDPSVPSWLGLPVDWLLFCHGKTKNWEQHFKIVATSFVYITLCVFFPSTPALVLRVRARLWPLPAPAWRSSVALRSSSVMAVELATITPTHTASGSPPSKTMKCLRKTISTTSICLMWHCSQPYPPLIMCSSFIALFFPFPLHLDVKLRKKELHLLCVSLSLHLSRKPVPTTLKAGNLRTHISRCQVCMKRT